MIDTGPRWPGGSAMARDLKPWLVRLRIRRIDAAVLTHGHDDHTGGADDLARNVGVGCWYVGGAATIPVCSDTTTAGAVRRRRVLHQTGDWAVIGWRPETAGAPTGSENDASLAIGLTCRDTLVGLWTGDLESAGERWLLPRLPAVPQRGLPYWKVGHHGSATSGTRAALMQLRPRLVGLSCGVANRHGHPSHGPYVSGADTATIVRTDLDGTLRCDWHADGHLRWSTLRGEAPDSRAPERRLDTLAGAN
jgi:competence protein ComEC